MSILHMPPKTPETLGDFVRRTRRDKNLSLADVSDRSARFGRRISASYVNHIENEPRRKVTIDRLVALAHGLGVSLDELIECAVGVTRRDNPDAIRFLARFAELSPERQIDVLNIIEVLHYGYSSERK